VVEIEAALCSWLRSLLGIAEVRPEDDFFQIGGHSLVAAELVQKVASHYRVHLNLSLFLKARTMRSLADWVLKAKEGEAPFWSPLINLRKRGSKPPIFLIAGVGGSVVNFELLLRSLDDDRPVYAIETRGLGGNSEVLATIENMAANYLEQVRRIQPRGAYNLIGYSFGGIIAFEMAQQLRVRNEKVGMLGLIDTPELNYTRQVKDSLTLAKRFSIEYGGTIRRAVFGPDRFEAFARRAGAVAAICKFTLDRMVGHLPPQIVVNAQRRNLEALAHYTPKFYDGVVHLFRCPDTSVLRGSDEMLGWGKLADRVVVTTVPGEHGNLVTAPYVDDLGAALCQCLAESESQSPRPKAAGPVTSLRQLGHPISA
jgi:thioesterase domain-containing protein/acyl carrier protein